VRFKGGVAIIGAGIGGLALAGFLARRGVALTVYEQASEFRRLGAGIQMSPNAVRVLRALGLEPALRALAFYPRSWSNRVADTGAPLFDLTFGADAEARYGAPYLLMHRGDLHQALLGAVPPGVMAFGKTLVGIERRAGSVRLRFADGGDASADAVIGADGVHSTVREFLLGPEKPRFTGRVAHRTVFPSALMTGYLVETCTKWWGPDRHIVIYPVNPRRDETYFVTSVPEPGWDVESWSAVGDMAEVRRAFAGFHDDVQRVLRIARTSTNGRSSNAIRCRAGARSASSCSATPVIRCCPIWRKAPAQRWRTPSCWRAASMAATSTVSPLPSAGSSATAKSARRGFSWVRGKTSGCERQRIPPGFTTTTPGLCR